MAAAAIPLGGALLGAITGEEERAQTERMNKGAAEANRFSDVTGRFQNLKAEGPGALGGAIKGASSFGGLASAFGGGPLKAGDLGADLTQTASNPGFATGGGFGKGGAFDALGRGFQQS